MSAAKKCLSLGISGFSFRTVGFARKKINNQLTKMLLNIYFRKTLNLTENALNHHIGITDSEAFLRLK